MGKSWKKRFKISSDLRLLSKKTLLNAFLFVFSSWIMIIINVVAFFQSFFCLLTNSETYAAVNINLLLVLFSK